MSVMTLEGVVEKGRIRLIDSASLPERARVYVVVPEASKTLNEQTPPDGNGRSLIGLFADEPELIDEVCRMALEDRANRTLRISDG